MISDYNFPNLLNLNNFESTFLSKLFFDNVSYIGT